MARRQLELSNEVAAELAGAQDQILRTLEEHLDCGIYLRGNVVTLDGEADAIEAYLPAELSDEELDALVATAIRETGAESPRDMGRAIQHVMSAAGGRADGRRVSGKVKEALTA